MKSSSIAIAETETPIGFQSMISLRSAHRELLSLQVDGSDQSEFNRKITAFIISAKQTGRLLDVTEDRRMAQSLLDYWADVLQRSNVMPPNAMLASFDLMSIPELASIECPYRGLDAFQQEDYRLFYGRRQLTEHLIRRLDENHFLALVGPSGSGKSSLVLAGVLPSLKEGALEGSRDWQYVRPMVPGSDPLANLIRVLQDLHSDNEALPQDLIVRLHQEPSYILELLGDFSARPAVLVVDQFEELFTLCSDKAAQHTFANCLLAVIASDHPDHRVILTLRSDYEPKIATLPDSFKTQFDEARVQATPMSISELRDAIIQPAELLGLHIDSRVVDALANDVLGEQAALPLLQFTLRKLWENRNKQTNQITWDEYVEVGAGRRALQETAEQLFQKMSSQEQQTLRAILVEMVEIDDKLTLSSHRIPVRHLYQLGMDRSLIDRVLAQLVQTNLIRPTKGDTADDDQVEVAHEALIRNWPRLLAWLEDKREEVRQRSQLSTAADEWMRLNRKDGSVLFRGSKLEEAMNFDDLDILEKEFIQASIELRDREAAAKEAQRQRVIVANARAQERAMAARVTGALAIAATVLAVWTLVLWFEVQQTNTNLERSNSIVQSQVKTLEHQEDIIKLTQAYNLAESALSELNSKPAHALQFAVEAITQTAQVTNVALPLADTVLRQVLKTVVGTPLATYSETAKIATSLDGRWLVAYSKGVGLQMWNMTGDSPLLTFSLLPDPASVLAYAIFSRDSHWLAVINNADQVRLWDVSGKAVKANQFLSAQGHQNGFANMAFDPTGQWLVTIDARGKEQLYALSQTTGELTPPKPLSDSEDGMMLVAFSPQEAQEKLLFVADGDHIDRWDIHNRASLKRLDSLPMDEGTIVDLRLDPDRGRWLATIDQAGAIWLRDLAETTIKPSLILTATVPSTESNANQAGMPLQSQIFFSPKGQLLATTRGDQTIQIWKLGASMPSEPWRELKHQGDLRSLAFSPNGRWLTVIDNPSQVCRWDIVGVTAEPFCLTDDSLTENLQTYFSADGRWLSVWGQDNVPRLWDLSRLSDRNQWPSALQSTPVYGHDDAITDLKITGDGKWLVTSSGDGRVRLLDLASHWQAKNPTRLVLNGPVQALTFTAADSLIAANAASGDIFTWQPATPLNVITRTLPRLVAGDPQLGGAVALHQSGKLVALGNPMAGVTLWKLASNRLLSTTLTTSQSPIQQLAFSRNGAKLAATTQDGVLYVWGITDLQPSIPVTISNPYTIVTALALSDDGRWLALGAQNASIQIWSLDQLTPQVAATLAMRPEQIARTIAFSADNQWLAVGGVIFQVGSTATEASAPEASSGFIRLWRLEANPPRMTPGQPVDLSSQDQAVFALAFSPQGDLLASGSQDNSVRLWDLRTIANGQKARLVLTDHAASVQNLAFSPDGHWLATLDGDSTLFLWDMQAEEMSLDIGKLVAAACRKINCPTDEILPTELFAAEPTYCGTCAQP